MNHLQTTVAFSVERIRAELLQHTKVPAKLVERALGKLEAQLEAKETKFFSFQGKVEDSREVVDHHTQQSAADKILSAAGVYVKDRDQKPPAPSISLEYDSKTGVYRIIVGDALREMPSPNMETEAAYVEEITQRESPPDGLGRQLVRAEPPMDSTAFSTAEEKPEESPVQVVKMRDLRKGEVPKEVLQALYGKDLR